VLDGQSTKQRRLAIACMAGPAIQAVMSKQAFLSARNAVRARAKMRDSDSPFSLSRSGGFG
ncbi:MAG: hypothetical protein KDG54_16515, partial [Geminicoccaceae bacterium]|nr:hypothetical protein [Geminicoccaceae bacterium]